MSNWAKKTLESFANKGSELRVNSKLVLEDREEWFSIFNSRPMINKCSILTERLRNSEPLTYGEFGLPPRSGTFLLLTVDPDGNCFWRSVAKLILGDESFYHMIKLASVFNLVTEYETWSELFPNIFASDGDILHHCLYKMAIDFSWSNEFPIRVASVALERIILCVQLRPDGDILGKIYVPNEHNTKAHINLAYHRLHFNPFVSTDKDFTLNKVITKHVLVSYSYKGYYAIPADERGRRYRLNKQRRALNAIEDDIKKPNLTETTPVPNVSKPDVEILNKAKLSETFYSASVTESIDQISENFRPKILTPKEINLLSKKWRLVSNYKRIKFYKEALTNNDNSWQPTDHNELDQFKDRCFGPVPNTKDIYWVDTIVKELDIQFPTPRDKIEKVFIVRWLTWSDKYVVFYIIDHQILT